MRGTYERAPAHAPLTLSSIAVRGGLAIPGSWRGGARPGRGRRMHECIVAGTHRGDWQEHLPVWRIPLLCVLVHANPVLRAQLEPGPWDLDLEAARSGASAAQGALPLSQMSCLAVSCQASGSKPCHTACSLPCELPQVRVAAANQGQTAFRAQGLVQAGWPGAQALT